MGWHHLSNKRLDKMLGDCSECGPDVRILRKGPDRFGCIGAQKRGRDWQVRQENARLIKAYGITIVERDALLLAQGGRCANPGCRATFPGGLGTWCVDHDHVTGKVRALLCTTCNAALGQLGDGYVNDRIYGLYEYAVEHGPKLIGGPGAVFELKPAAVQPFVPLHT